MNRDERISEEQLNAFVDDELEPNEKRDIYSEASRCPDLDQRLCQQRKVKELVQLAYEDVPRPERSAPPPLSRGSLFSRMIAASLLLAAGLALGMIARNVIDPATDQVLVATEPTSYLLHVASGSPDDMAAALQRAEHLLATAPDDGVRHVEIVANEQGLNLLRSDVTQFADQISLLQANDVVFYACSRSIQRLEEHGIEVRLVPHTVADYTALDRVVMRMQEGWNYEKI